MSNTREPQPPLHVAALSMTAAEHLDLPPHGDRHQHLDDPTPAVDRCHGAIELYDACHVELALDGGNQ